MMRKRKQLDWKLRLSIINGIARVARGLPYLHEDSLLRVIHRDLKASNLDWQGHLKWDRTNKYKASNEHLVTFTYTKHILSVELVNAYFREINKALLF